MSAPTRPKMLLSVGIQTFHCQPRWLHNTFRKNLGCECTAGDKSSRCAAENPPAGFLFHFYVTKINLQLQSEAS